MSKMIPVKFYPLGAQEGRSFVNCGLKYSIENDGSLVILPMEILAGTWTELVCPEDGLYDISVSGEKIVLDIGEKRIPVVQRTIQKMKKNDKIDVCSTVTGTLVQAELVILQL